MILVSGCVSRIRRIAGCDKPVVQEEARMRPAASEVLELVASSDRLTAATGWTPSVSLEDGLAQTIEWWRTRPEQLIPPPRYAT